MISWEWVCQQQAVLDTVGDMERVIHSSFVHLRDLRGCFQIKSQGLRATRPSSFEASGASLKSSLAASQNNFRLIL